MERLELLELLKILSFGARVAEKETSELAKYFVETDQWSRIFHGEIDVIRGGKGAGKSAIYSLLATKADDLFVAFPIRSQEKSGRRTARRQGRTVAPAKLAA